MKKIKIALGTLLLLLTVLWLLADTFFPQPFTYFSFRQVFLQYSGLISIGTMSISLVLSVRPLRIEKRLGGLDKMYRLHKWLGIAALVSGALHWWWAIGSKWMVGWGWLAAPSRPQGRGTSEGLSSLQQWIIGQRGFAEDIGGWAFYIMLILIVLALIKKFPYHLFVKTHKLLCVAYLMLAWHTIILLKPAYWMQPVGWFTALLLIAGTVSCIIVLLGRIGFNRKAKGHILSVEYYPELRVTETIIKMDEGWAGHQAGQFAFVKSNGSEKPHPYTMASAWNPQKQEITFMTKALGDYTDTLHEVLKVDGKVTIEGPYGQFTFNDQKTNQIWIAGGIGITPFIARMKQMANEEKQTEKIKIDLFHSAKEYTQVAIDKLTADATAAGVRLHIMIDDRDGLLTGEHIREKVPNWKNASIWFSGPVSFYKAIKKDFAKQGFDSQDLHHELFDMR